MLSYGRLESPEATDVQDYDDAREMAINLSFDDGVYGVWDDGELITIIYQQQVYERTF